MPVAGVLGSDWDLGSYAMEGRILGPLVWFGLLEQSGRETGPDEARLYRKTPLFDQFVKFNVQIEGAATRH